MPLLSYDPLLAFTADLFQSAGMENEKARTVSEILIEADLIGHRTHGLALVPWYIGALADKAMAGQGAPEVISDRGACVAWNGKRLPGTWLTKKAVDLGLERVEQYGTVTVSIAEAHHTGALAAYMRPATEKGYLALINCSTNSVAAVAPYGGTRPLLTPNPIAMGIPTDSDPILIDISSSIATLNMARTLARDDKQFAGEWVLDAQGNATADPNAVVSGGGSLLPLGGVEYGHKGYGMALMVEALSNGLSGFGRRNGADTTCLSVFVQIIDPDAFGGRDAFIAETSYLAEQCRTNPPRPGIDRVRLPGDSAAARRACGMAEGIEYDDAVIAGLRTAAKQLSLPTAIFDEARQEQ